MRGRWMGVLRTAGAVLLAGLVSALLGRFLTSQSLKAREFVQELLGFYVAALVLALVLAVPVKLFSRSFSYGRLLRWCVTLFLTVQVLALIRPAYLFYLDRPVFGLVGTGAIVLLAGFYLYRLAGIAFPLATRRARTLGTVALAV